MDIENKIKGYKPNEAAIKIAKDTHTVLLVGIAGAGKDTLKKKLISTGEYIDIVSHTTRSPRVNNGVSEQNGLDYYFTDMGVAEKMVDDQSFIEVKYVHGTVYGTSTESLRKAHDAGKIAINDIDVQGVDEFKHLKSDVIAVFILPPSYDVWIERLKKRYATEAEFNQEWPKRRDSAIRELKHALEEVSYYHFVLNDDLEQATVAIDKIAHSADKFHRKDDEARLAARDILKHIEAQ